MKEFRFEFDFIVSIDYDTETFSSIFSNQSLISSTFWMSFYDELPLLIQKDFCSHDSSISHPNQGEN
jgi:hypothetical protein